MNPDQRLPSIPEIGVLVRGKYRLLRLLGEGEMGAVYEARHEALGVNVALKFLHPRLSRSPSLVERFLDDARLAAATQSPEIQVLDVDQSEEGLAFVVLDLAAALSPTPPPSTLTRPSPPSRTSIEVPWFAEEPPVPEPPQRRRIGAAIAVALVLGIAIGGGAVLVFPSGASGGARTPDSVVAAMMAAPSTAVEADPAPPAEVAPTEPPRRAPLTAKPLAKLSPAPKPTAPADLGPPLVPPPHRTADPPARLPAYPPPAAEPPPARNEPDPWPGMREKPPRRREVIVFVPIGGGRYEVRRRMVPADP